MEGQAAASARHWEGKGTANPRTLRVVERKLVCLQRHQNDDDLAFLSPSPPDTQVEEKQEKPTRNPVYFPFCFLSIFISALHPHPKKKKKVIKGTKCKQKSSGINHDTNFCKPPFCLCVTSPLLPAPQTWPASIQSRICPGQGKSE